MDRAKEEFEIVFGYTGRRRYRKFGTGNTWAHHYIQDSGTSQC
ncbi:MAG TPA: hypothetical protein VEG44_05910 [Candidatus Acidoferrales bacterium]|nr:hypothetical protein [Candidatus Acidoferrales bacterium]